MSINLHDRVTFVSRHNGQTPQQIHDMTRVVGVETVDELIEQTIPNSIRRSGDLKLPKPLSEYDYLKRLRTVAAKNKVFNSFIGQGYYGCVVPPVIQRNILENPGWYTAYTPYQADIAQGRVEALLN